jgi:hypothetical protein
MPRGKPKGRRLRDVLISDYDRLSQLMTHPDHLGLLADAVEEAKKNPNRFGWAASADQFVAVDLDEAAKRLLRASFYTRTGEYLDESMRGAE